MKSKLMQKRAKFANYSWGDKIFLIMTYVILFLIAFVCLYPMYFTVIASFSEPHAVYTGKVNLLPKGFTTEAYELVFQNKSIWLGYANTIFYTVAGTCFNLFLTIPAAYALSKKKMFGRNALMMLFIITMYFGGGMIPTYLQWKSFNLINTRMILIMVGGLSVSNMIVTRTYFQNNIPEELFEAARIDGASELRIFWKIVIPLSAPIIAVITLYYAVGHWSSYFSAMIYITDRDLEPLQIVLRRILIMNETTFEEKMTSASANASLLADAARRAEIAVTMKYSVVFIASLPMLIIYPFIQKHFVKGIMVGGLKG